jgi:hypothetical protein
MLWKWVGSFLLTAALILPILTLASTTVKERENKMKDLLEISGLVDAAYWGSYVIAGVILCQVMTWIAILMLLAGRILTVDHIGPYAALMTCYALALVPFLLSFGFIVFRAQYYSLPAFLLSVGLCVGGDYLAQSVTFTIGAKCLSLSLPLSLPHSRAPLSLSSSSLQCSLPFLLLPWHSL